MGRERDQRSDGSRGGDGEREGAQMVGERERKGTKEGSGVRKDRGSRGTATAADSSEVD